MKDNAIRRIAITAAIVFILDQLTKTLVLNFIDVKQERVLLDGFFKLVNWGNTGAAWSLFYDNNMLLAGISLAALAGLIVWWKHFDTRTSSGQAALGLVIGGILGNLLDRLLRHQVIDFLRFYMYQRDGREIGFPAFNVADSGICIGVALLVLASWSAEDKVKA
jgi:signal peptidase II